MCVYGSANVGGWHSLATGRECFRSSNIKNYCCCQQGRVAGSVQRLKRIFFDLVSPIEGIFRI